MTQDDVTQDDMTQDAPATTAGDASRSGRDVVEAVERAAAGTRHDGVQTAPEDAKPHAAPVEQVRGDSSMTTGRVGDGPGAASRPSANPDPAAAGSGGAQSVVGARVSDREAAGEQPPADPSSSGR